MHGRSQASTGLHRVVIVGGGFGGLLAAQALNDKRVEVTLLDRRNFHLFQPLLYQVATGTLSPANIATPLRAILSRQRNAKVLLVEVTDFDLAGRRVLFAGGELRYDSLIVAAGSRHHYFGNDRWERLAPGLKTIEDATEIRRRIFLAFEAAERETDPEKRQSLLTFVIVGGGPTGVELAGSLAEIAHYTLKRDFREINPADAKIILLEGGPRVLPPYTEKQSASATSALERLGVTVLSSSIVKDVQPDGVRYSHGDKQEFIAACTVLWGAGVKASPLVERLAAQTGVSVDRAGRIAVQPDLTLPGHPEVFVVGDAASFAGGDGKPLPGIAPVAMQQGKFAAGVIKARVRGKPPKNQFRYRDWGTMATIGRGAAVADLRGLRFSGYLAWLAWLFIHLMYIIEFQNRLLVLLQWGWNYFSRTRAARLITGENAAAGLPGTPTTTAANESITDGTHFTSINQPSR